VLLNQNQTSYLSIRLLSQSQTIVKPKPKPKQSNCQITGDTQLKTPLVWKGK